MDMDTCECTHLVYVHVFRSRRGKRYAAECSDPGCTCFRFVADERAGQPIEPILTPAQVGLLLRVDPRTVRTWMHAGAIEAIRTRGGQHRYRLSEVRRVGKFGPGRNPANEQLLTTVEFADRVGRHPKTVRTWANAGRITYVRTVGNHKRIPASELARVAPADGQKELTPAQFAEELQVHPKTLQRWARAGKVRANMSPGGHRRYPESEVDRLKSSRANQAAAHV